MTMDNPFYMPKGWRSGSVRLGPTVAHQESTGTYVKARGRFGPELWDDASATFTGSTTRVSPGVYRIYSPDGTFSAVSVPAVLILGRYYAMSFTIDTITVVGSGVANDGGLPSVLFGTTGAKQVTFQASSAIVSVKRGGAACDIQVSNISVREIL